MSITRVLGVPIDSVGAGGASAPPFGTEKMPAALRSAGLAGRLAAAGIPDDGDLAVRVVGPNRDSESGLVGWPSAAVMTQTVRSAVAEHVRNGDRPLLLGGCCALLPGAVAGVRDARGAAGVVNIDGHMDLYDERTSPSGEIADVPITALLGLGVPALQEALSPTPVLGVADVALVGYRDADEAAANMSMMPSDIGLTGTWDVDAVTAAVEQVAEQVGSHLTKPFWVHLDLDVLDELVLPATDYLMPGGLNFSQLARLLRPVVREPNFAGMSVTCLNPDKDPGGASARDVTDLLVDILIAESG